MIDRLEQMEQRYNELQSQFALPEVINDHEKYQKTAKALREIEAPVEKYRELKQVRQGLAEARAMLAESDPEMHELAAAEIASLEPREPALEEELKLLLLPKDPNDEKNVILEIRAGTGGDEASLFAAEIFRMYTRFAEQHRWKVEVLSLSESGVGGYKEVIAIVEGERVYSQLKWESGVTSTGITDLTVRRRSPRPWRLSMRTRGCWHGQGHRRVELQCRAVFRRPTRSPMSVGSPALRRSRTSTACLPSGADRDTLPRARSSASASFHTSRWLRDCSQASTGAGPPPRQTRGSQGALRSPQTSSSELLEALEGYAQQRGVSLLDVAIGGLLVRPVISSVIAGATRPEQVRANAAAARWTPTEEDLDQLRSLLAGAVH